MMRNVYCDDAIDWLRKNSPFSNCSFVASLPDISEFPQFSLLEWKEWFTNTAKLILSSCPDDGVCIFFQSDIKHEGFWIDKGYLCLKAAEATGHETLFHKIVCRAPADITTFGRPAYSHLICFSKNIRLHDLSKSTPDVISDAGDKTWQRGMGLKTALIITKFIAEHTPQHCVMNPFCGEGSVLAAANHHDLKAIGIEKSAKRAEKSRKLLINKEATQWVKDTKQQK